MLRRTLPIPVMALVLLTGACTSDNAGEEPTANATADATAGQATCGELLGDAGVKWLESRTGGAGAVRLTSDHGLEKARSMLSGQIRNWEPGRKGVPSYAESDVCRVTGDDDGPAGELAIDYRPSILPFDAPITGSTDSDLTETPVNSDVRLLRRVADGEEDQYVVFVTCKLPGTPEQQENAVPIEGTMTDSLTGDTGTRARFTHLLHSAQVMTGGLDCQNEPVIPAEPPASVK
ncbi:hypothetical protein [Streptomyces sp. NPDC095613]|uniref:hypothetical protein n=1 Tax=Streptomyces sp. NPDC095613 TaxID=3155540 RepID=UPI003325F449